MKTAPSLKVPAIVLLATCVSVIVAVYRFYPFWGSPLPHKVGLVLMYAGALVFALGRFALGFTTGFPTYHVSFARKNDGIPGKAGADGELYGYAVHAIVIAGLLLVVAGFLLTYVT
jgi:hypothetical protein